MCGKFCRHQERSEIDLDLLQKSIDIRKTLVITRSNQDNG